MKIDRLIPYKLGNRLYWLNFTLYKFLYFIYKHLFEKDEIESIQKYVKKGSCVIDVGANIGFYTLLLAKLVGNEGKVYAFEPEDNNFRHLANLCKGKKNILLNNLAVGERTGKINLYRSDSLNVDHQTFDNNESRSFLPVKCVSLDQFFNSGKKIDFIKIDTQGFEYKILLGMRKLIENSKSVTILCEIDPAGLSKTGHSSKELVSLLRKWGFKIQYIYSQSAYYSNIIAHKGI